MYMLGLFMFLAVFCFAAVVYPYAIYPLTLKFLKKWPVSYKGKRHVDGSGFSLLFCAYNELASVGDKVSNIKQLKLRYPKLEVLAFDDDSSDGTADYIAKNAPFIKLVRGSGRNGKAYGMKLMAKLASGRFLVFTDANVMLDITAIDQLQSCYSDENVGGVCGALHYLGAEESSTSVVGGLYWRVEERIKDLESATGSVMGADGSIFSIRSELYPEFPDTVLDDFTVSMEVVFRGLRLIKCNEVVAYEKLVTDRSDEFARKVRIAARAFHTHISFYKKLKNISLLDRYKYFSHKTLRWFGGFFLSVGALSSIVAGWLISPVITACVASFLFLFLFFGLKNSHGYASSIAEVMLAIIATMVGVIMGLRGKTYTTWSPAKSRS